MDTATHLTHVIVLQTNHEKELFYLNGNFIGRHYRKFNIYFVSVTSQPH